MPTFNPIRYPAAWAFDDQARTLAAQFELVRCEGHAISTGGDVEIEPAPGPAYESAVNFIATAARWRSPMWLATIARLAPPAGPSAELDALRRENAALRARLAAVRTALGD